MRRVILALALSHATLYCQSAERLTNVEDAIREALSKNLDLAAQRLNVSVVEARRITATLRPNPVLTLSADHLDLLGTGFNSINNAGPSEYAIRTDFVIERGGKRALRMALSEAETGLAELELGDIARKTIFDVASAFIDVQQSQETLALAKENLRNVEGIVNINKERVRTGDLAVVELDRSRLAALQYQGAVRQAELRLEQAKNRLQLLLGRAGSPSFDVEGPIRRDVISDTLDVLEQTARRQRPDLLGVRQAQARSQADLKLQIAQGKVDYTWGVEARRQDGISGRGNMLGFFFSAPLPLSNRNQGEIARANREIAQATARVRSLDAAVNTEVRSAWQQYTVSNALLTQIESDMLSRARDVRNTMEYSYRRGEATLVEYLDAQRAFNETMQSYNEARADYARSLYLIESVTATNITGLQTGRSN
jgi:outer membrane protein, heavy metal efflux system